MVWLTVVIELVAYAFRSAAFFFATAETPLTRLLWVTRVQLLLLLLLLLRMLRLDRTTPYWTTSLVYWNLMMTVGHRDLRVLLL